MWDASLGLSWSVPDQNFCNAAVIDERGGRVLCGSDDGDVVSYDLGNGRRRDADLGFQHGELFAMAVTPDGSTLVEAGEQTVATWGLDGGGAIVQPLAADPRLLPFDFVGASRLIVGAHSEPSDVDLVDVEEAVVVDPLDGITSAAPSSDPGQLSVIYADGSGGLYPPGRGRGWRPRPDGDAAAVRAHGCGGGRRHPGGVGRHPHPDAVTVVATADGRLEVVDPETLEAVGAPLAAIDSRPVSLEVDAGGGRVAVLGYDRAVQLVDVVARQLLGSAISLGDGPSASPRDRSGAAVLNADGDRLALYTSYGTVVWDLRPEGMVKAACAVAGRNLTRAEWDRYAGSLGDYRKLCPDLP